VKLPFLDALNSGHLRKGAVERTGVTKFDLKFSQNLHELKGLLNTNKDIQKIYYFNSLTGLFFTQETVWKEQRRFVVKNLRDFGFGRKSMESMIQEEVKALIDLLKRDIGKPISTKTAFNAGINTNLI